MGTSSFLQLMLLAAIWGGSFLFQRIASPEFGPIPLVAVRAGSAALVLLPFFLASKHRATLRQNVLPIFLLGLLSTAIPFVLFSYTTLYANAGYTALLNATVPIFSAIIAYFWLNESLSMAGLVGVLIGFIGVLVLITDAQSLDNEAGFLPVLAAMVATFSYGLTGCYTQVKAAHVDPLVLTFGSQAAAAMVLGPAAVWLWPSQSPDTLAWVSAAVLGMVCTGFAFILFYGLIARVGVEKTVSVTYLIPVFAVVWGSLFLNELITLIMLIGGSLVLLGVGITTGLIKYRTVRRKREL